MIQRPNWQRVRGHKIYSEGDISITVPKLLGMVMSAWMMVVVLGEKSSEDEDCALLRGDKSSGVQWINRCQGDKELRAGALMRFLGILEIASEW